MTKLDVYPVCKICTRGCGTNKMKPALSLLLGWEEMIQRTIKTRKNNYSTISNEDGELHYLTSWYQSGRWKPCLFRCLIGSINVILILAVDRAKVTDDSLNEWIEVRSNYGEFGLPASEIVHNANTDTTWHMLDCALAYWIEAALSYDRNEPELAWQPLLQAQMYIGMAAGPISQREAGNRGRDKRHEPSSELTNLLLKILSTFSNKQFYEPIDAVKAILSTKQIQDFQDGEHGFDDIGKVIENIRGRELKVRAELERVSVKPLRPGRPRKQRIADELVLNRKQTD